MKDMDFLKEVILRANSSIDAYFEFAHIVACCMEKRLREQLNQLVNGPVYDGSVISKSDRDQLLDLGLAVRVCVKGQQGYTGATYFAFVVNKKIFDIATGKTGA